MVDGVYYEQIQAQTVWDDGQLLDYDMNVDILKEGNQIASSVSIHQKVRHLERLISQYQNTTLPTTFNLLRS